LHQPKDLDTAVDLALLQEGVLESYRHETRRANFSPMPRALPRNAVPLPPPPAARLDSSPTQRIDDKRDTNSFQGNQADDKIIALRNYRRARGLCFTCGEHFSREHRCGPTVQLHIVKELLALVQPPEDNPVKEEQALTDAGSQLMHISQAASDGGQAANSMRLQGWVQQQEVLMLVDSSSSHTFVSASLAARLSAQRRTILPLNLKVAMEDCCNALRNYKIVNGGLKGTVSAPTSRFCLLVHMTLSLGTIG
jgi:hypothetical protein